MDQNSNLNSSMLVQNPDLLLSCASIDDDRLTATTTSSSSSSSSNGMSNVINYDHSYSVMSDTTTSQQNMATFDLASHSNMNSTEAHHNQHHMSERQFSFDQFIQPEDVTFDTQKEIRDEILDLNILELLQTEEPEMARLIDQASSLDSICNYLPQISVNTTSKVLDSLQPSSSSLPRSTCSFSSMLHELSKASNLISAIDDSSSNNKPVLFKLEDITTTTTTNNNNNNATTAGAVADVSSLNNQAQPHMHSSTSFKELCELLSIKKVPSDVNVATVTTPSHSQLSKLKLLTPPLTPTDEESNKTTAPKPSRTSMRLFQKRNIKKEPMEIEDFEVAPTKSTGGVTKRREAAAASARRKKSESLDSSSDSDDKSSSSDSKPLNSSNENSMDLTSYYEPRHDGSDDSAEEDEDENEQSDSDNDSSNENYSRTGVKRRLSSTTMGSSSRGQKVSSSSSAVSSNHPIKKESNKEAATRYRLKKITEKDKLFETRFNLEKENDSKRRQIELVQTEINYLKTILVQFILTKSCINTNNNHTGL